MIDDVLQGTKSMNRKGARNGMGTKALAVAAGALALAIGLFSAVPASYADSGSDQATHWGHWRALSGGFVGRRRVPANIDLPVAERRQSHVTARSDFVQRLQRRFNRQHGGSRRGGQLPRSMPSVPRCRSRGSGSVAARADSETGLMPCG